MINRQGIITDQIYASADEVPLQKGTSEGTLLHLTLCKVADKDRTEFLFAWFLPYKTPTYRMIDNVKRFLGETAEERGLLNSSHLEVKNDTRIKGSFSISLNTEFINVKNKTLKNGKKRETIPEKNQYTIAELIQDKKPKTSLAATIMVVPNPHGVKFASEERPEEMAQNIGMEDAEELLKYWGTEPEPGELELLDVGELSQIAAETEEFLEKNFDKAKGDEAKGDEAKAAKKRKAGESTKPPKKGKVEMTAEEKAAEKEQVRKRREEANRVKKEIRHKRFKESLGIFSPNKPATTVVQPATTEEQPATVVHNPNIMGGK